MFGRRFLVLVVVLMGLTALAATVAPRQPVVPENREQATPTPAAPSSPTFETIEETVSTAANDTRVSVSAGDLIELTVTGTERDSVMVLDRIDAIDPEAPARFSLRPGKPGEYPIELLEAGREVGTLVVREAG